MKKIIFSILVILCSLNVHAKYKGRLKVGAWQQSWNDELKSSLKKSGLLNHQERAISNICPNYNSTESSKILFWQQLMVSLAWKESLHGSGNYIHFNGGINKGLYQINPKLRRAYGCKGYDLYNPLQNIKCAVNMAKKLVRKYGSFLKGAKGGMAAYWQPLRGSSSLNRSNRAKILSQVKKACQSRSIAYISTAKKLTGSHNWDPYEQVDLSFNSMDGEDINLEGNDLEIETGIEEEVNFDVVIGGNTRTIDI